MFKKLTAAFQLWQKKQNYKAAVRKANYLQAKTFKIQHVFLMKGKFVVIARQDLKYHQQRGAFGKNNMKEVSALALYTTTL